MWAVAPSPMAHSQPTQGFVQKLKIVNSNVGGPWAMRNGQLRRYILSIICLKFVHSLLFPKDGKQLFSMSSICPVGPWPGCVRAMGGLWVGRGWSIGNGQYIWGSQIYFDHWFSKISPLQSLSSFHPQGEQRAVFHIQHLSRHNPLQSCLWVGCEWALGSGPTAHMSLVWLEFVQSKVRPFFVHCQGD